MKKNKKFLGVRVDENLYQQLSEEADREDRSINYVVERFLREGVKHLVSNRNLQPA
jgi:predicted HicB family RNase H-like nuclease